MFYFWYCISCCLWDALDHSVLLSHAKILPSFAEKASCRTFCDAKGNELLTSYVRSCPEANRYEFLPMNDRYDIVLKTDFSCFGTGTTRLNQFCSLLLYQYQVHVANSLEPVGVLVFRRLPFLSHDGRIFRCTLWRPERQTANS